MRKAQKILVIVLSAILVFAVVVPLAGYAVARIGGYRTTTVLSGSMEPTYSLGDLLILKRFDPDEDYVGKPITFVLNDRGTVVTHRVVKVTEDEKGVLWFTTKGDNNEDEDGGKGVHQNNVVGVPVFRIPYLGFITDRFGINIR